MFTIHLVEFPTRDVRVHQRVALSLMFRSPNTQRVSQGCGKPQQLQAANPKQTTQEYDNTLHTMSLKG